MNRSPHLIVALLVTGFASFCAAQEDPFGAGKPAAGAAAAKPVALPEETKQEPLVIELLRAGNLTTAETLTSAAQSAFQFGRPDEAKVYLAKLLEAKPADDALAALVARYGDLLLQLRSEEKLQPEGKQVANLVYSAAERVTQSATRINEAIGQLSDPRQGVRDQALAKLSAAGTSIVNPMLAALADANRETEHANIRSALVALPEITELPLIAALDASDPALKAQVIAVLARMGSTRAAVHFVRPAVDAKAPAQIRQLAAAALTRISGAAPDLYEAEKYLLRETQRFLRGELPLQRDPSDRVMLWAWDAAKQGVVSVAMPRRDAGVLLAARTTNDLYALKAGDNETRRLMLLVNLELAKVMAGLGQPLPIGPGTVGAMAIAARPQVINQVLSDALAQSRVPAAIAAAEVLGHCGDASVLHTSGGPCALVEALVHPDRRVRMAAALTCIRLAPGDSFAGASRVSDALGWFVNTSGVDVVLVGHPRGEDAQSLVGFMNDLGYDGEAAYRGRVLAERAFVSTDAPFILISDAIDSPPVEELVQWLRRDFRTARQPVGVMARGERFEALREALESDRFTTVFPRIHSTEVAGNEIDRLKAIAGRNLVGRDERLAQAQSALAAFGILAKNPTTIAQYELLRQEPAVIRALNHSFLSANAAAVLALLATPTSQSALMDFASQNTRPLADRQAAAKAFAAAVKLRGLRLTQQQITHQYARYNASQSLDQPTQALLGSIIDAIEAPAIARGDLKSSP